MLSLILALDLIPGSSVLKALKIKSASLHINITLGLGGRSN